MLKTTIKFKNLKLPYDFLMIPMADKIKNIRISQISSFGSLFLFLVLILWNRIECGPMPKISNG